MATISPIKQSDALRKDWRTVNSIVRELVDARAEIRRLSGAIEDLRCKLGYISPGGTGEVKQFEIESVAGDHLLCKSWDGTTLGSEVKVLKPYHLRRSPFDDEEITYSSESITVGNPGTVSAESEPLTYDYLSNTCRKVTRGTVSEYQVVIPFYTVGELIYAMHCADDLVPSYPDGEYTGDDVDLVTAWLDLNIDGRAWARQTA